MIVDTKEETYETDYITYDKVLGCIVFYDIRLGMITLPIDHIQTIET